MSGLDYDVVIIGSGFGGSVAALRAAEKGYPVAVIGVSARGGRTRRSRRASGTWRTSSGSPRPSSTVYRGSSTSTTCSSSRVPASAAARTCMRARCTSHRSSSSTRTEWAGITDWADELAPYFDQARRMFGVVRYPYMPTDVDRAIKQVANDIGRRRAHNKAPLGGVFRHAEGVEAEDPYFGGVGPRRTGCVSCGNCNNGCGRNAKNKVTTNYLYLAEKLGAKVHAMHEVHDLVPLDGGGFEVHARHPGWAQRAGHLHHQTYTAEQVIVAAHTYGSASFLHHMQHKGRLAGLSSELGKRARTNSEQLLYVTRTHAEWERDRERIHIMPGSVTITSGTWPDPQTSIEPTYWGLGSNVFAFLGTYHQHGEQKHSFESSLKEILRHPSDEILPADPRHWSERSFVALCSQTTDTSIELYWHDGLLHSKPSGTPPSVHVPAIEDFVDRMAKQLGTPQAALRDRGHQPQRLRPFRRRDSDRRGQRPRRCRPLPAHVRAAGTPCHGRERNAGHSWSEPVALDHGPRRTRDLALAQQGRPRHPPAPRVGLPSASSRSCRTAHSCPQALPGSCDSTPRRKTSSPHTRTEPCGQRKEKTDDRPRFQRVPCGRARRRGPERLRRSLLPRRPQAPNLGRPRRRPPLRVRRPLPLRRPGMPAVRRAADRDDAHVPVPRLPVRHHHGSRDQRPGDRRRCTCTRCKRSTAKSRSERERDENRTKSRGREGWRHLTSRCAP